MSTNEKIVLKINSSSLRYSHCLLSWYRTIVEGWVQEKFSSKIVYGLGLHKFCNVRYRTQDLKLALDEGIKEFNQEKILGDDPEWLNSVQHFHWTCFTFWENFLAIDSEFKLITKPDGTPASEVTFEIPFYEDETVIVYLVGTIDSIGKITGGMYAIRDFKTTSFYDKKKYFKAYRVSHQLRFYRFALTLMGRMYPETELGFIGRQKVGTIIDGIFLKERPAEVSFERSEVFDFSDEIMSDFEQSLVRRIKELSRAIKDGTVKLHEGIVKSTCELKYNVCPFFACCATLNNYQEQWMLERNFVQRPYDPLHRDKAHM